MAKSMSARVASGYLATLIGKLSTVGLSLFSVVILARVLEPEEYGGFLLLRVFALFLAQLTGFGLDDCLPVIIPRLTEPEEKRKMINTALIFRFMMVIVFSILAFVFQKEIAGLLGKSLMPPELAVYLPVMLLCEAVYVLTQSSLQSFFQFRQMGKNDLILSVSNFGLMLLFILVFKLGAPGLVYARIGAQILSVSQGIRAIPVQKKFEFYGDKLREALRLGLPLQFNAILTFIFTRIDTIVVGSLLGPGGVAFYEVGRRIPDNLRMLYDAFRNVYFPFVSKMYTDKEIHKLENFLNTILRVVAFITLAGTMAAVLGGHEMVRILFSEQYLPAAPVFMLAMLTLSLRLVGNILGTSIVAIGETGKPAITSALYIAVSFTANILLIPSMGITGAALASLLGVVASNPLDYYFLWRKIPGVSAFSYLKPIAIFAAFALLIAALQPNHLLIWVVIFAAYLVADILFGVITLAEINDLRTRAPRFVRERLKHRFAGSVK